MADLFDRKLADEVIGKEGGYVNDPRDSGGETIWGITKDTARRYGYTKAMVVMPRSTAVSIYRARYWTGPGFDKVAAISEAVAAELFDTGVNMGINRAGEFLQRALNALNNGAKHYPDIGEDGEVGPATRRALTAYLDRRGSQGEVVLLRALNALQGTFYLDLAARRPKDEAFVYGWLLNRVA